MRQLRLALLWGAPCLLSAVWPLCADAQDDGELTLMREPHSYVDVVDAFDDDDPFDVNVTLGYEFDWTFGNIQREDNAGVGAAGGDPNRASFNWRDIAHHQHQRNMLNLGLEVGIFRDLAIYGRLPIIMADDRRLGTVSGAPDPTSYLQADADLDGDPTNDPPLFSVPFDSPTRSGLDHVVAGLAWSIFNQNRDRSLPTWLIMIEGRLNLGDPMIACRGGSATACRTWTQTGDTWDHDDTSTDAGETRGTNALRIETRASWRTRYVEPFAGLAFQIEWPDVAERFFLPAGDISGIINEQPPIFGQFTGGLAIIPWEDRGQWQRFAIDIRLMGRYVSEGHGYTPLFDALGTSDNALVFDATSEGVAGAGLRTVPFFGLTDVQPHSEIGGQLGIEMRAARFVRFQLGAKLWYVEPYIITYTDACNPNEAPDPPMPGPDGMLGTDDDVEDPRQGTCRSGIINPHHRPVLDMPGQAFRLDEQIRFQLYINATGMF